MPARLTKRNGTWHFVRKVPKEFAHLDRRGVVRLSTEIRVADDRAGVKASRVADRLKVDLEASWRAKAGGPAGTSFPGPGRGKAPGAGPGAGLQAY
jgi:hypothetical protein